MRAQSGHRANRELIVERNDAVKRNFAFEQALGNAVTGADRPVLTGVAEQAFIHVETTACAFLHNTASAKLRVSFCGGENGAEVYVLFAHAHDSELFRAAVEQIRGSS